MQDTKTMRFIVEVSVLVENLPSAQVRREDELLDELTGGKNTDWLFSVDGIYEVNE